VPQEGPTRVDDALGPGYARRLLVADPGSFVTQALVSLERSSKGAFSGETFAPFVGGLLADHLGENDRADFIAPVILPPTRGRVGRGHGGVVVTLEDRAIVGWEQGVFSAKWQSAAIPYNSIKSVEGVSWGGDEGGFDGLDVTTAERVWTFAFRSADTTLDLELWRNILWNRLDGTLIPLWDGDHVTRWVTSDTADAEATESAAQTGRRYDKAKALMQLEAHERVRAATCGALRCQDAAQLSMESGTLFLTSRRLIFISPTEDRPLTDLASIDRTVHDLGAKQAELISVSFKDGSSWELASTTRTSAESEYFCSAVREALAGTSS
jgi:hypothetical protein